ncbi:hypothetical protein GBA52_021024 [Prunus armeniaca]|nr:hypothetical protein GBA52_021024 [Prunus armeniaca]
MHLLIGSYGSTLRCKSVERMKPIGKHSLLGASGEISGFQELLRYLDELILYDNMWDDGNSLGPKEVHNYLTRVVYNRRNKFNPPWNSLILGGVKKGQKYLGIASMIGVNFEDNRVATGFGNHLARPILRDEWHENLTFEEGVKLLEKCMRVLLYRDRSAVNKLQILCGYEHHMILNTTFVSEEVLKEGRVRVVASRLSFDPLGLGAVDCGRSSSSVRSYE